ncbi:MAG: phosphopentomutase [Ramlibacter sp.]|nr:phosphopentomutase [Ramlibacter sp.]
MNTKSSGKERRAFILVMDSLGIGATPDAERYGDVGTNTLAHIAQWRMEQGKPLRLPELEYLGLGAACALASGSYPPGMLRRRDFSGAYAAAREQSRGKDTPSGHWEMAGVPVPFDWGTFPRTTPCFPEDFLQQWMQRCHLQGVLGNCHASGTEIINQFGDEHRRTGWPIVYTSSDSVFQVAVHEAEFGLQRLYDICQVAFELLKPLNVARVIARPFLGSTGRYTRTSQRKDIAVEPPGQTLLDIAKAQGREVIALGKIGDIFAHRGMTQEIKAVDNHAMFDALMKQVHTAPDQSLVFTNFVDFDQNFGHRRDVSGYAAALEAFDIRLAGLLEVLRPGDLCVITADHGCDPTQPGSDHTREHVPHLYFGPGIAPRSLGVRESFSDLGQTLASHLGLPSLEHGVNVL